MSHQPERKEKDCLNCGTLVQGRYCQYCGQENIIPHQNFLSLTKHFIYDIFHFDGKFFDTLKYMLIRPGRVPREYVLGRRTKYLDPIRMYLFTSAVFFLIFFSTQNIREAFKSDDNRLMTKLERFEESARLYAHPAAKDSNWNKKMALLLDTTKTLRLNRVKSTATEVDTSLLFYINNKPYSIQAIADTITIKGVKENSDAGWMKKHFNEKWKTYKKKYGDDTDQMLADLSEKFVHWFPYILFVSLPFFAFILKLLYIRRKQFFYSDHAIFTLYHYIYSFILLLLVMGFTALQHQTGWGIFSTINVILMLSWPVYLYLAMRRFYGQAWFRTFSKFVLLNFLGFMSLIFIFILFILLFIFQL